jgi:hypothetical protein
MVDVWANVADAGRKTVEKQTISHEPTTPCSKHAPVDDGWSGAMPSGSQTRAPTHCRIYNNDPAKTQPRVPNDEYTIRQGAPPARQTTGLQTGGRSGTPGNYMCDNKPQTKGNKINKASDIPRDISSLDCEAIGQCLSLLKLSKHRDRFVEEQINGSLLAELDVNMLVVDFGFSKFEATKLIRFSNGWRPSIDDSHAKE